MVKIKIIVHIAGEEIDWDKIPEEKRRIISEKIQETMMSSAGYKRLPLNGGPDGQAQGGEEDEKKTKAAD